MEEEVKSIASLESVLQACKFKEVVSFLHRFNLETTKSIPEDLDSCEDKLKYDTYIKFTGISVDPTRPHGSKFGKGCTSEYVFRFCVENFLSTHHFSGHYYLEMTFTLYHIRSSIDTVKQYLINKTKTDGKKMIKSDEEKVRKVLKGLQLYEGGTNNELDKNFHYKQSTGTCSNLTNTYVEDCEKMAAKAMLWIEDIIGGDAYIK